MFFKNGGLRNFAIFTGKHLCWGLYLIKYFLKGDSNKGVSCGYFKIFKNNFFYGTPLVAASDSPTTV